MSAHVYRYSRLLRNRPRTGSCSFPACSCTWRVNGTPTAIPLVRYTRPRRRTRSCSDGRIRRCTGTRTTRACSRTRWCSRRNGARSGHQRWRTRSRLRYTTREVIIAVTVHIPWVGSIVSIPGNLRTSIRGFPPPRKSYLNPLVARHNDRRKSERRTVASFPPRYTIRFRNVNYVRGPGVRSPFVDPAANGQGTILTGGGKDEYPYARHTVGENRVFIDSAGRGIFQSETYSFTK